DITIYPNRVQYYEKLWNVHGSNDPATSRSFIFSFEGKNVILPVIEVLRSILAPNGFFYIACLNRIHFLNFSQKHTNQIKYILVFHRIMNRNTPEQHLFINWFGY